jgi:hypothetical protein
MGFSTRGKMDAFSIDPERSVPAKPIVGPVSERDRRQPRLEARTCGREATEFEGPLRRPRLSLAIDFRPPFTIKN